MSWILTIIKMGIWGLLLPIAAFWFASKGAMQLANMTALMALMCGWADVIAPEGQLV